MADKSIQVDRRTHLWIKLLAARDGKSMKETVKLMLECYAATRQAGRKTP